ncbi:MAG: Gfo/Idh/MocA family protein [Thermomicrobiales bacterium]|jgi:predicted dehydrogenase|nr:Gfo/Idh/MocA family oxidoreductase [Thermomicrobiales bacterium]
MTKRLRVGVVGVGAMGEHHTRVYAALPEAELVGVYDPSRDRAAEVAARWQTRAWPALPDLLAAVDALSIASPTSTHEAVATQALERGVHVLVEKPLAASLAAGQRLAAVAARHPALVAQVGFIERFNPCVRVLHRYLAGQRIVTITIDRLSPFGPRCLDTDVIHDLMIHDIDLTLAALGEELTLLRAEGEALHDSGADWATAWFTTPDGATATLRASRVAQEKVRRLAIVTERATLRADLLARHVTVTAHGAAQAVETIAVPDDEPLRLELQYFLTCAASSEQPIAGVDAGLRALVQAAAVAAAAIPQPVGEPAPVDLAAGLALSAG